MKDCFLRSVAGGDEGWTEDEKSILSEKHRKRLDEESREDEEELDLEFDDDVLDGVVDEEKEKEKNEVRLCVCCNDFHFGNEP